MLRTKPSRHTFHDMWQRQLYDAVLLLALGLSLRNQELQREDQIDYSTLAL